MENKKEVMKFLNDRFGKGLAMVDIVAHGTRNQVDKLNMRFGGCDSYTEDSNKYKGKEMLITPFVIHSNNSSELDDLQNRINGFTKNIGGTKTVEVELWTYTDDGLNDLIYEDIKIIK